MKILVPIDFSKSSKNAALYAAKFAKKANAEVILFNVIHFAHPPMVQIFQSIEHEIEEIRLSNISEECVLLVDELKAKAKGVPISFKVIEGQPIVDAIENYVSTHKIDLVIMGTNGDSGLEKVLFDSNAMGVINKSSVPVITIPLYCRFNHLKRLLYASNMHAMHSEIQKIIPFAEFFEASISILHVLPPNSNEKIDRETIETNLIKKYKYPKISFHVAHDKDVIESINEFVADLKVDMLVMYTHESGFFENLFKTNLTREEALHGTVPLLTLKI